MDEKTKAKNDMTYCVCKDCEKNVGDTKIIMNLEQGYIHLWLVAMNIKRVGVK